MVRARTAILNRLGLHARPAMTFVQLSNEFSASVKVRRDGSDDWIDGKSIMQMLLLAATEGTAIEIEADGPDEERALESLVQLIVRKFDEE